MTRPWPMKLDFPVPDFREAPVALLDELDAAEPAQKTRQPDGAWVRPDGKRVECFLVEVGKACLIEWTLDGERMRPSEHSSLIWAQEEMDRWRNRDTLTVVIPKAGDEITLDSGGVVRLCQFVMEPVWRSKQARRCWVVEKVRGFRATQKKRFTVAESEVLQAMQRQREAGTVQVCGKVIDLMDALKASLAKSPKGAA